jgi:alpha-ketoglutaric semialdehyde dehydrogenase
MIPIMAIHDKNFSAGEWIGAANAAPNINPSIQMMSLANFCAR